MNAVGTAPAAVLLHDLLAGAATAHAEGTALIERDVRVDYRELDARSNGFARWLAGQGMEPGARVVVMLDNCIDLGVAVWAIAKAGCVLVLVNPATKAPELAYVLRDCAAVALVAPPRLAAVAREAAGAVHPIDLIWADTDTAPDGGGTLFATAIAPPTNGPAERRGVDEDIAAIIYTSGSTGTPKGVMLTHRNMVHSTWSIDQYLQLRNDDVIACALSMSFGYGLFHLFLAAQVGAAVLVERGFAFPVDVLSRMVEHRATVFPGVPTFYASLLQLEHLNALDLSSLRILTNAAAALPVAHIERLRELLPQARLFSMYGQTECTRTTYLDPDDLDRKPGSVGLPIPNTEAFVVDDDDRRVGPGVVGELVVRGASVMRGYWGRPGETARCVSIDPIDGTRLLHTGDLFQADEDGYLYFVGRTDDVFKCRGEKVAPKHVESVLYELDDVLEVAVVGVPDPLDGEAVKAYVVLKEGTDLDERRLRRHCQGRLRPLMVPRFVELVDELPKTVSGKIRRADLRES